MSRKWFCVPLAAAMLAAESGEAGNGPAVDVKVPAAAGIYVRQAVLGAQRRLADDACRSVLSDFATATGDDFAAVLAARGVTPQAHLSRIRFVDGSQQKVCSAGESFAGMLRPGDDVVYVCPLRFKDLV